MLPIIILLACSESVPEPFLGGGGSLNDDTASPADDTGDTGTGVDDTGTTDPLQEPCAEGESGAPELVPAVRLASTVTWTLDFDGDPADCSYTREYSGLQRLDMGFLCPDCEVLVQGTATMTDGLDCYANLSSSAAEARTEQWGWASGNLYRSGGENRGLGELTAFSGAEGEDIDIAWSSEGTLSDGTAFTLQASGTMRWQVDADTLIEEPFGPRAAPYACGWECEDPGDLSQDYALALGSTLPNVRLEDACGEPVDLWDFYGSYIVIDSSQSDCGPCRSMAEAEPAFVEHMRQLGVPVRVVTLMGGGLSDSAASPSADTVASWIASYGLEEPVLRDRGYATALFPGFIDDFSGEDYGFPVWLVVDPQLRLIHGNVGFSSWDAVSTVITDNTAR